MSADDQALSPAAAAAVRYDRIGNFLIVYGSKYSVLKLYNLAY